MEKDSNYDLAADCYEKVRYSCGGGGGIGGASATTVGSEVVIALLPLALPSRQFYRWSFV